MPLKQWLYRYRILQVLALLIGSLFVTLVNYDSTTPLLPQAVANFIAVTLSLPVYLLEYNKLVPDFLFKQRFAFFVLYSILAVVAFSIINYMVSMPTYHLLSGRPMFRNPYYFIEILGFLIIINTISAGLERPRSGDGRYGERHRRPRAGE